MDSTLSIAQILADHTEWLSSSGEIGAPADLTGCDLTGADLTGADLTGADLTEATLAGANPTGANLTGANLTEASLAGANLTGATLTDVGLRGTIGNMYEIKSLHIFRYPVAYTATVMQIGCKQLPIADWWRLTELESEEDTELWQTWKPILQTIIATSPAVTR